MFSHNLSCLLFFIAPPPAPYFTCPRLSAAGKAGGALQAAPRVTQSGCHQRLKQKSAGWRRRRCRRCW